MTPDQKKALARAILHGTGLILLFAVAWGAVYIAVTDFNGFVEIFASGLPMLWIFALLWAWIYYEDGQGL